MKRSIGKSAIGFGLLAIGASLGIVLLGRPTPRASDARGLGTAASGETVDAKSDGAATTERATFALGCFWHSEEIFLEIKGVKDALPGYAGGTEKNPSYEEVSSGNTRYAESVDITFDPTVISYGKLLQVLFTEHDPTTPNMQYPDEGPQYRSVIFYHNESQKAQAEAYIARLTSLHTFKNPIVTEVVPFTTFVRAEDYHLRYYRHHPDQPYIAGVTKAEVEKFRRDFPELLKAE